MKKIMTAIIILTALFTNLISYQKQAINNSNPSWFQFNLIVNNKTSNVGAMAQVCFYLDIKIMGITLDDRDFNDDINLVKLNTPNNGYVDYAAQDLFIVKLESSATLIANDYFPGTLDSPVPINFTFGTFYEFGGAWYHAQLTFANNYQYNFKNVYNDTNKNGVNFIIDANGGDGANIASWGFQYFKF